MNDWPKFCAAAVGAMLVVVFVGVLIAASTAPDVQPRFHFKQHVKVASGFYQGCSGHVVEAVERINDFGKVFDHKYRLSTAGIVQSDGSELYRFYVPPGVWFASHELEPINRELPPARPIVRDREHKWPCPCYPVCPSDKDHPLNNVKPLPIPPTVKAEVESIDEE